MSSSRTNSNGLENQIRRCKMGAFAGCKTTGCNSRNYPGLLRLDSTGEISSAIPGNSFRKPQRKNPSVYSSTESDNFTKTRSVMNSIGARIGSAASYFGNFCQQNTLAKEFVKKSFIVSDNSMENMNPLRPEDYLTELKCPMPVSSGTEKTVHWTENIFDVIHSSLMNNCSSCKNIMNHHPGVQKYVPPQRRCGGPCPTRHNATTVDPKLTPYNAKLLQKNKQQQLNEQRPSRDTEHGKSKICAAEKRFDLPVGVMKICENNALHDSSPKTLGHYQLDKPEENGQTDIVVNTVGDGQSVDVINNNKETTDWFEYENKTLDHDCVAEVKAAPVENENAAPLADENCDENLFSQGVKELRNWFSVECDNEVKDTEDAKFCESSQTSKGLESICDNQNSDNDDVTVTKQTVDSAHPQRKESSDSLPPTVAKEDKKGKPTVAELKDTHAKVVIKSDAQETLLAALYIRNCGKRNRPSAKKRRRHKAQQNAKTTAEKVDLSTETKISKNANGACQTKSIVAFILGHDSDSDDDNDITSFHVKCNFDSDSDWSEYDSGTDENLSSFDDEELQGSDLGFRCNDPLLFRMSCSVQPVTKDSETGNHPSLDMINTQWKVQVSVETDLPKKKSKSTKQVHFAESKSLATMHPMVTWCYAYQAARKGPWEEFARDRARFMRRVSEAEDLIKPILHQKHRNKIFSDRFAAEN